MNPVEEILYHFDTNKDPNDFLIWLNENRDKLITKEIENHDNSFNDGYDLGWEDAMNKE